MKGPWWTQPDMSSTFQLICLLVIAASIPSCSFPLRHVGGQKKVTQHKAENRELILCWVMQVRTRERKCPCRPEGDYLVAQTRDGLENVTGGSHKLGSTSLPQPPACTCQLHQHTSALSREVGLHLVHTFEQFHDHFLLCLMDFIDAPARNTYLQSETRSQLLGLTEDLSHKHPASRKSKSQIMSRIHRLHSDVQSTDKLLFDRHKTVVENRLQQHEEVVWFSSEYIHRHHSRSLMSELSRAEKLYHPGIGAYMADTGQAQSVVDTGHSQSVVDTGQAQSVVGTGQAQSVVDTGQDQSVVDTGQDQLTRNILEPHFVNSKLYDKHGQLVFKNSQRRSDFNFRVHGEDGTSSVRTFVQPDTTSWRDDWEHVKEYSLGPGHPQTPANDTSLHGNKPTMLTVSKRSLDIGFNDPKFPKQWHLVNRLTTGMDLNVTGVWMHNYTGHGVTVAVVDDGLEWTNPDLQANYNQRGSWDMNDDDPDPTPSASKLSNHHGTRCAGEIAAIANNHVCGVGVAYQAQISGLRVLDGLMTDSMEAEAFNMKMDINDVYSCSWGPDDDGRTVDGPHLMAAKALQRGVDFGRRGYGSIYVLASGNGGENHDNCNFDGYANSIYTVTVGAVDDKGSMPYYAEECASMLGVTFSSGTTNKRDIVTTDWTVGDTGGCTESHTGTSAAAPLAAAMIALMLQARPCLSWRDVQYIIILTAQMVDVHFAHSQRNGAGLSHSHKHGFGLLNAWRLVNAARVWPAVPWLTSYSFATSDLDLVIPKGKDVSLTVVHVVTDSDIRGLSLFTLENVQLTLTLSHPCRGKIGVTLTSPSGTVSVLAAPRPRDNSTEGFREWTFTSVRCWGETPTGNWTFSVTDHDDTVFGTGLVTKWRLTLFGTSLTSQEFADRQQLVESAMSGHFLHASPPPCPEPPKFDAVTVPVSDRILKVLILCGAFCFIMAVYETFEYLLCYGEEKQEAARCRRLVDRAQELTHTTRVLDSSGHQLSQMANDTSSLGAEANHAQNMTDDDGEEEDIFESSETSRLLTDNRRCPPNSGGRELGEAIPLATFSLRSAEHSASGYLPLPLATGGDNATDTTLNMKPDHTSESRSTSVMSDCVSR